VSDGPGSPEACPSCGVPLSPAIIGSRPGPVLPEAARRQRKSQRLRALATVLALTAVMLIISAIGVALAVVRANGSDRKARSNLQLALRTAEAIKLDTGSFVQATPAALRTRLPQLAILDSEVASSADREVSMVVTSDGGGWYGSVRSHSGRCFAFASVSATPLELTALLPGNCTGDAARAALMRLPTQPSVMTSSVPAPAAATSSG
jgi:hypothetical protein